MLNELKYTLGNYLSFSRESMLALVEEYHSAVSPLPLLGLVLGILIFTLFLSHRIAEMRLLRTTLIVTGLGWILIGTQWQIRYLAQLDWSAAPAGWAMLGQGGLLILSALLIQPPINHRITVRWAALFTAALGGFGIALLQWLDGLTFGQLDRFGVDANSTALITAAVVMLLPGKFLWLLLMPWLWSVRQFTISWPLGDGVGMLLLPLLTVCILMTVLLARKDER